MSFGYTYTVELC